MRLENFVDIMGINVIQVIERIQRQNYSSINDDINRYVNPDHYMNVTWPNGCSECSTLSENKHAVPALDDNINDNSLGNNCKYINNNNKCMKYQDFYSKEKQLHDDSSLLPSMMSHVWKQPPRIKLITVREFLKQPIRVFSDAERVIRRDKNKSHTDREHDSEKEDKFEDLLNEIRPLHVNFYDKFYRDDTLLQGYEETINANAQQFPFYINNFYS